MGLKEDFENPPAQFRQAPFWFWNHDLDKETLSWQIGLMKNQGLGGFVMHARHGLITPYLSDAWMDCIRHCCEEAKKHGMIPWAYDERDWPSGPAAGEVIKNPENRLSFLRLEDSGQEERHQDERRRRCIAAYREEDGRFFRLDADAEEDAACRAIVFECPPIFWFDSYLDTLSPEACQNFIASTYDAHEDKLGDLAELGLAGFFTDEPAFSVYPDDLSRIPWTPGLPEAFLRIKGYDLLDHLPLLRGPGGEGAQVRVDYWDVATTLFEESFYRPISEWCEKRGLQLIGHPLGEEPLLFQFRCLGNIFKYLRHQHMPGMDQLGMSIGKGQPLSMTPKLVASAALLAGRERTMTETFGDSGWTLSLREMKWICDWQIVNGINYFMPHAFFYSIAERRKRDAPPSEFYQAPYWPYYKHFADYTARLTSALTGGDHIAPVALFYPMTSVWAGFLPGDTVPDSVARMEAAFAPLGEALLAIHRDFVVLDEEYLAKAKVRDGGFEVNGLHFQALVLPPMTAIGAAALDKVREIAQGALAVSVDNDRLRVLNADGEQWAETDAIEGMVRAPDFEADTLETALASLPPDVRIDNAPDLHYLHRRKEGQDFYFFANTDQEPVACRVSLATAGAASLWDPETGNTAPLSEQCEEDGRLAFPLRLAAMGSALIAVDASAPAVDFVETPFQPTQRLKLGEDRWHFTPYNGNFLALDSWRLKMSAKDKVNKLHYRAEFSTTEDLANLRLILDGVPEQPYGVPESARPIMAPETQSKILLDGKALDEERPWEIDPQFRVLELEGLCEPGTHRLDIFIRNQGWFPQPGLAERAWIAGDFMIEPRHGAPCLSPVRGIDTGPWEEQGFPHFSGTAAYVADLDLPSELAGKRVYLNAPKVGTLLDIEVNGRQAAIRPWPPYYADITPYIWPGEENLFVLKVTNTMKNFIEGPDPSHPSGLLEDVYVEIG